MLHIQLKFDLILNIFYFFQGMVDEICNIDRNSNSHHSSKITDWL